MNFSWPSLNFKLRLPELQVKGTLASGENDLNFRLNLPELQAPSA